MKKTLSTLLKHCASLGMTFVCYYDDFSDPDYRGTSQPAAKEALEACDVMNLVVLDSEGKRWGWALIVNEHGQNPEEQVADYTARDPINFWFNPEEAA
jgi:hypothetical protein